MTYEKEIRFDPNESASWCRFMHKTIELDNDKDDPKPHGWHWFWALYYLQDRIPRFDFEKITSELPDKHWLNIEEKKSYLPDAERDKLHYIPPTQRISHEKIQHWVNKINVTGEITEINFSEMHFGSPIDFSNFIFPINVNFSKAGFSHDTLFINTTFHGIANFNDIRFIGDALFNNAKFFIVTEFGRATFSKEAHFSGAEFGGITFVMATFSNTADFAKATFSDIAGFRRARFFGLVRFDSATFNGGTSFADTIFETRPPHFYSAKISEDITWDRAKFPSIKKDTNRDLVQQNKEAYANLSYHMEQLKKYDDQHLFFREEMRCRRRLGSAFSYLIHWLYEWFADYGYGVGYALCWWAGHIALGVLVIAFISMWGGVQFNKSLPCAISVSFANANPYALFGFDSVNLKECYKGLNILAPTLFAIVKAIQTILGVGLLFLVLLTLRIRFRLK